MKELSALTDEIIGQVRFPVANPDFSAFVQRAKDINPESIMVFIPGGAQPAALGKAFAERGIDLQKTKVLGSGVLPQINTGMAGRIAGVGQVGAGLVTPPMECFEAAIQALAIAAPTFG